MDRQTQMCSSLVKSAQVETEEKYKSLLLHLSVFERVLFIHQADAGKVRNYLDAMS